MTTRTAKSQADPCRQCGRPVERTRPSRERMFCDHRCQGRHQTGKARPTVRKYEWDKWFGKDRFVLKKGRHFHCGMASMSQMVRDRASKLGLRVSIREGWMTLSVTVTKPEETTDA